MDVHDERARRGAVAALAAGTLALLGAGSAPATAAIAPEPDPVAVAQAIVSDPATLNAAGR